MRFVLCLLILISSSASAGPWPRGKGNLYLKLNQWWVVYDSYYNENKNILPLGRSRSIGQSSIYAEYGIDDRWTATVYFPFYAKSTIFELKDGNSGDIIMPGDQISSVGDTDVKISYALTRNQPIKLDVSLQLGLPFGVVQGGMDGNLQTGDGEFNQMLKMEAGGSFKIGKIYPYVKGHFGFNNRTNNYSEEIHYGLETGMDISFITLILRGYGVSSLFNGEANNTLFNRLPAMNNTEFLLFAPEVAINFSDNIGIAFSYIKVLDGRNYFNDTSYSAGIFYKTNK